MNASELTDMGASMTSAAVKFAALSSSALKPSAEIAKSELPARKS